MVKLLLICSFLVVGVASASFKLRHPRARALSAWYSRDPCTGKYSNDKATSRSAGSCVNTGNISVGRKDEQHCDLVSEGDSNFNITAQAIGVEFWYSTENIDNITNYLAVLEEKIFRVVFSNLSWCYAGNNNDTSALTTMDTPEVALAKELGILGVTSSPKDVKVNMTCPHALLDANDVCYVHQGKITLYRNSTLASIHPAMRRVLANINDLNSTLASIQLAIRTSMESDALLGKDIPSVRRVTYLGETEPVPSGGSNSNATFASVLAFSISAIVLLLLLLFFKKRKATTERELESLETDDPAGSFHHGHYHYTVNGERYLSKSCPLCLDTARELSTGPGLAAISEDKEMDDVDFCLVAASSKDLGRNCSTMNVVPCKSAVCEHCKFETKGVGFVPAFKYKQQKKYMDLNKSHTANIEGDSLIIL